LQGFQISNKQGFSNFNAASNAPPTLHILQGLQHFNRSLKKFKNSCLELLIRVQVQASEIFLNPFFSLKKIVPTNKKKKDYIHANLPSV
jgi:hypothetical protein